MKPSLQKLYKILDLEADRGYDNRAVVGGLERILESWEAEARNDGLPEDLIQAVGARLRDYTRLSESSRAEALNGLRRRLARESGESPPPDPAQKKEEETPPTTPEAEDQPVEPPQSTPTPSPPAQAPEPQEPQPAPEPPAMVSRDEAGRNRRRSCRVPLERPSRAPGEGQEADHRRRRGARSIRNNQTIGAGDPRPSAQRVV